MYKISLYLFAIFIVGCAHLFHPFIFSLGVETENRYFLILLFFGGTLIYLIAAKRSLMHFPFFLNVITILTLSAMLTRHNAFDHFMIIIHVTLMYSLFLLFIHRQTLQEIVIRLLLIYAVILGANATVGFIYVNFFDNTAKEAVSIYAMFGQDDSQNGYFYVYKPYFGLFANAHVWGDSKLRVASFMFEPNAFGIFMALNIALLIKKYGLSSAWKKIMFILMLISGFTTISVTFFAITGFGIILYLSYKIPRASIFLIILFSISAYFMFAEALFDRSSINVRLLNATQFINKILTDFTLGDHLFGRGTSWSIVEIGQGIDSGYLAYYTQYGIFFTVAAIILFVQAGHGSHFAMSTLLLSPVATNLQFSYIYLLYVVLLITVPVVRAVKPVSSMESQ